jgi:predicted ATPase
MLTRLEALHFGCLRYIDQDLGSHHLLVGPNGSGKSTFVDALGFLSDLVSQGLEAAVETRASDVRDLIWRRQLDRFELAVEVRIPQEKVLLFPDHEQRRCRYEVAVGVEEGTGELAILSERVILLPERVKEKAEVVQESLFPVDRSAPDTLVTQRTRGVKTVIHKVPGGNDKFYDETGTGWDHSFKLGPRRSTLANLPDDEQRFPIASWLKGVLAQGVCRLTPDTGQIRRPSRPGRSLGLDPNGANLPWLIADLEQKHPERLAAWVGELKAAVPGLQSLRSVERTEDRHRYILASFDSGLEAPAWLLPDGTLRAIALTFPSLLQDLAGVLLVEEPEQGLPPEAAVAVYRSLASLGNAQVIVTSHSPSILKSADPSRVLCLGLSQSGATDLISGTDHEGFAAWTSATDLGALSATGIMG